MKRVQRKRTKGWKMPPNTKYVGRSTRWGNPFRVVKDDFPDHDAWNVKCESNDVQGFILTRICRHYSYRNKTEAINDAIRCYLAWLFATELYTELNKLRNYDGLACWCDSNEPCHVDLLIDLLNL